MLPALTSFAVSCFTVMLPRQESSHVHEGFTEALCLEGCDSAVRLSLIKQPMGEVPELVSTLGRPSECGMRQCPTRNFLGALT